MIKHDDCFAARAQYAMYFAHRSGCVGCVMQYAVRVNEIERVVGEIETFGVSDAEALARDTHKYESQYLTGLLGPYPERRDIYYERSPINFPERLSCPVIFFQGLEDKVVPPDQAEKMVEAMRAKRIPVAYVAFEGEQHGFRQANNIKRALDGELYFYSRIFGFDLADPVEPVPIANL